MGTTVKECISQYIEKYGSRLKRLWLCPQIVHNPKVGKDYTLEVAISSNVGQVLSNAQVTKHWKEGDCLCIAYKADDVDIIDVVADDTNLGGLTNEDR